MRKHIPRVIWGVLRSEGYLIVVYSADRLSEKDPYGDEFEFDLHENGDITKPIQRIKVNDCKFVCHDENDRSSWKSNWQQIIDG